MSRMATSAVLCFFCLIKIVSFVHMSLLLWQKVININYFYYGITWVYVLESGCKKMNVDLFCSFLFGV